MFASPDIGQQIAAPTENAHGGRDHDNIRRKMISTAVDVTSAAHQHLDFGMTSFVRMGMLEGNWMPPNKNTIISQKNCNQLP